MPDGNEGQYERHSSLHPELPHHMRCTGMQVPHGQLQVTARLHTECISVSSHRQSMSDPVLIRSDAVSGHSLFCQRFPTVRPIQTGTGTLRL